MLTFFFTALYIFPLKFTNENAIFREVQFKKRLNASREVSLGFPVQYQRSLRLTEEEGSFVVYRKDGMRYLLERTHETF